MRVELTRMGSLVVPSEVAARCFGDDATVLVDAADGVLRLTRLADTAVGGLLLKRRNAAGDRSVLVIEYLPESWVSGEREADWDDGRRTLSIAVWCPEGQPV